jgi:hypothetical protein
MINFRKGEMEDVDRNNVGDLVERGEREASIRSSDRYVDLLGLFRGDLSVVLEIEK